MSKAIIALILLLVPGATALAASSGDLKDSAPDSYTVVVGDTLWGISGRYLKEPWRWPELWKMNQEQIRNPHRIYPGDVLVLDRSGHEARLRLANIPTEKLVPRVRSEPLGPKAVSSISPAVIGPFLTKPLVVGQDELDSAPRIVATQENRVAVSVGDVAYAEGLAKNKGDVWQIFRRGDALVDPDTKENLGYEATYLGEARVRKHDGDIATIVITKSAQEIYVNDRLLPARELPTFAYVPHAPQKSLKGRIISAYGNLQETGPNSVVTLSRGSKDGLEVGHVLAIYRSQSSSRYTQRTSALFGRSGLSGNDEPRAYVGTHLPPRDAPVYTSPDPLRESDIAKLPDERYGLVMVFRTFDRAAYGLVMQASRPVALNDVVANP
jgi:hypothetical protein